MGPYVSADILMRGIAQAGIEAVHHYAAAPIDAAATIRRGENGIGRERTHARNGACSGTREQTGLRASADVSVVVGDDEGSSTHARGVGRGCELHSNGATSSNWHAG